LAENVGPNTRQLIENILEGIRYPIQAYRPAWALCAWQELFGRIMEKASREAIEKNICSYKYLNIILKQIANKPLGQKKISFTMEISGGAKPTRGWHRA